MMGYFKRTLNYQEKVALSDLTHTMSMVDFEAINMETSMIDCGWSFNNSSLNYQERIALANLTHIMSMARFSGYRCGDIKDR